MRLSSESVALAAFLAVGVAQAQSLINELSFGHSGHLNAVNGRIPHFTISGQPQQPEVLSNKVILTPMGPGNQRSSIWADAPLTRSTWEADVDFRASGPDRASGNLNVWFARRGQQEVGTNSVYTAGKFDGLALVVDSHGSYGGMIRGFLNDGSTDYATQHSVDKLAFGQCDYYYRNLGRPSQLKLRQTGSSFRVEIDGKLCFETDKVSLPPGYYFGITAATPEVPDSFEVFKLTVLSESTVSGDKTNNNHNQANKDNHAQQGQGQGQQGNSNDNMPNTIPDQSADAFLTSKEQFQDLHNRLQAATHQISAVYNAVAKHSQMDEQRNDESKQRHNEMKQAIDSLRHELTALRQLGEVHQKIKDLETEVRNMHHEMGQKIAAHGDTVESTLRSHHHYLAMALSDSIPGHGKLMVFFVCTQVVLVLGYVVYKRRRASSPKKYL